MELAKRVRDGIIAVCGVPLEFPVHPIQETGKRPTAALDRNLTCLSCVEVLYGYPMDGAAPGQSAIQAAWKWSTCNRRTISSSAAPEAAAGGGLALLENGDRLRVDLRKSQVNVLADDAIMAARRSALKAAGGYAYPASQTPWQEMHRATVSQFDTGMVIKSAPDYQRIAQTKGLPRDSH